MPEVARVLAKGLTRSTVLLKSGLQVDLRVVEDQTFGAALHYLTGSKEHNIAIRRRAIDRDLKISEYGIFRGAKRIGGREENEIFEAVDLPWIPPELRENDGEIEAAESGQLPSLLRVESLRGDLHVHTNATDGRLSLSEMAQAAMDRGREYLAINDHSKSLRIAKGMDSRRLREQIRAIDRLNEGWAKAGKGFRLLKGCEVDILEDGSLDMPDSVLSLLDLTVCSVHSHFKLSAQKQIDRLLRAMDHPAFTILGHPSSRLIGSRAPIELDLERVLIEAQSRGVWVEVNSQPERLDLDDQGCRMAREIGVGLVLSTDAHDAHELDFLRHGVDQARRGWIGPEQVLNTRGIDDVLRLLKSRSGPPLEQMRKVA